MGSLLKKRYDRPQTPCQRLMVHAGTLGRVREQLQAARAELDPLALLRDIRQAQSALAALKDPESRSAVQSKDLSEFLAGLADIWRQEDV